MNSVSGNVNDCCGAHGICAGSDVRMICSLGWYLCMLVRTIWSERKREANNFFLNAQDERSAEFQAGNTYMSIAVECVVGQLDFVENHWLRLPMWSERWTVRVDVHALRALRLGATSWDPLCARELETAIADCGHLEHDAVVCIFIQAGQCNTERRKHSSGIVKKPRVCYYKMVNERWDISKLQWSK